VKNPKTLRIQGTQVVLPGQEDIRLDLQARCREAVRAAIQVALDEELAELVGAEPYEHNLDRIDYRNGSYPRGLVTALGPVQVQVGRSRAGGAAAEPIGRYRRRTAEIDDAVTEAYVHGVSTRGMGAVTRALMGEQVRRSTVSRVTKRLEGQVESLRQAPITEPMVYLYLDATFLDARWARTVENVSALVAYAVGPQGYRELLGITIGAQESEESWAELLRQLVERGLHGVRLVIADQHAGLRAAVRKILPEAQQQRCTFHLTQNVTDKVPQRHRKRVAREVVRVLHAPSLVAAKAALKGFATRFRKQFPEAVACLEEGFAAATTYYALPKEHWVRIRTTNGLERLHGEIKRRIRSVGAFPDRGSALRLITAVALQVTSLWTDRRYLDMSVLDSAAARHAA
jgi:putative transposase